MKEGTKILSRAALLTALGAALLYVAAILPTGQLAVVAVAGLLTAAALIHCGLGWSVGVFVATALLGFLIAPQKVCPLLYAAFLGYYPIAKSLLERIRNLAVCWVGKLVLFNVVFCLLWLLAREMIFTELDISGAWIWPVTELLATAVFVVYDIGISRGLSYYISRISKHVK